MRGLTSKHIYLSLVNVSSPSALLLHTSPHTSITPWLINTSTSLSFLLRLGGCAVCTLNI